MTLLKKEILANLDEKKTLYIYIYRNKDEFWRNLGGLGIEVDPLNLIPNLQLEMKTSNSFSTTVHDGTALRRYYRKLLASFPKSWSERCQKRTAGSWPKTVECIHPSKMLSPFCPCCR